MAALCRSVRVDRPHTKRAGRSCVIRGPTYAAHSIARPAHRITARYFTSSAAAVVPNMRRKVRLKCAESANPASCAASVARFMLLSAVWSLRHFGRDGPALVGYDPPMNDCCSCDTRALAAQRLRVLLAVLALNIVTLVVTATANTVAGQMAGAPLGKVPATGVPPALS